MQSEFHGKARVLLDRSLAEDISAEERRWLDAHLAQCAECSSHAELSNRAIRALDSFAFDFDPAAAERVQQAVRAHATKRRFAIGIPVAVLLTILGSLAMWQPAAWLAARWNLPTPAWQITFAILWLMPSVVLDLLLLFRAKFGERI